jgi:hypothetical protein
LRTIYQPDTAEVRTRFARVVDAITAKYPDAATYLDETREYPLAFTAFPHELWRRVWSNNPQERLNKDRVARLRTQPATGEQARGNGSANAPACGQPPYKRRRGNGAHLTIEVTGATARHSPASGYRRVRIENARPACRFPGSGHI